MNIFTDILYYLDEYYSNLLKEPNQNVSAVEWSQLFK